MKVGHSVGLSVGELSNGKWRLRWRLDEVQANQVVVRWRQLEFAPGTIYQSIAAVVDLWTWAYDEPDYTDVVPPPAGQP